MLTPAASRPAFALVDDDFYSARFLMRAFETLGSPPVAHHGDPALALDSLASGAASTPDLLIVDLKQRSTATRDFIAALKLRAPELLVVAVSPTLDRDIRDGLLAAGAAAVFQRHADIDLYRQEASSIVSFWARHHGLDRVGS